MERTRLIPILPMIGLMVAASPSAVSAADAGISDAATRGETSDAGDPGVGGRRDARSRSSLDAGTATSVSDADSPRDGTDAPNRRRSSGPDIGVDGGSLTPSERLERAERAFRSGAFARIPPLLTPVVEPEASFDAESDLVRARELLGVGLYFTAEQVEEGSDRREALRERSRTQFLKLLRQRPQHELDPLIYPASVVDFFDDVRSANAEELEALKDEANGRSGGDSQNGGSRSGATTLYIERRVGKNFFLFNFVPGAIGQFQNGERVKGWLLSGGQVATVAFNTFAFLRLRMLDAGPTSDTVFEWDGRFCTRRDGCDNFQRAQNWRTAQYVAWSLFGSLYVFSVVDGILNFEESRDIEIRTLDEPPPEFSQRPPSSPKPPVVRIGLGTLTIRW